VEVGTISKESGDRFTIRGGPQEFAIFAVDSGKVSDYLGKTNNGKTRRVHDGFHTGGL
jgi:hypothetical protein